MYILIVSIGIVAVSTLMSNVAQRKELLTALGKRRLRRNLSIPLWPKASLGLCECMIKPTLRIHKRSMNNHINTLLMCVCCLIRRFIGWLKSGSDCTSFLKKLIMLYTKVSAGTKLNSKQPQQGKKEDYLPKTLFINLTIYNSLWHDSTISVEALWMPLFEQLGHTINVYSWLSYSERTASVEAFYLHLSIYTQNVFPTTSHWTTQYLHRLQMLNVQTFQFCSVVC